MCAHVLYTEMYSCLMRRLAADHFSQSVQLPNQCLQTFLKVVLKQTDQQTDRPSYLSLDASLLKHKNGVAFCKRSIGDTTFSLVMFHATLLKTRGHQIDDNKNETKYIEYQRQSTSS